MPSFTAYFRTDANYATLEIGADTPELALKQARKLANEDAPGLWYQAYDDGFPVNEIAIEDTDYNERAVWQDDDLRLRIAARDMLEYPETLCDLPADDAGERTIPAGFLDRARTAIAKAQGGAP